jgi:hypothetical protein
VFGAYVKNKGAAGLIDATSKAGFFTGVCEAAGMMVTSNVVAKCEEFHLYSPGQFVRCIYTSPKLFSLLNLRMVREVGFAEVNGRYK